MLDIQLDISALRILTGINGPEQALNPPKSLGALLQLWMGYRLGPDQCCTSYAFVVVQLQKYMVLSLLCILIHGTVRQCRKERGNP